jgi:hypothetical protein
VSVFISYTHKDQEIAEKIAFYLVRANIHIWIDKWELNVGDSLIQKIQNAVTEASVLLVMLSKTSIESEWCKKELSVGLIRELEEKRVVVIPVLLEDCDIPIFLRDKYYADFREDFESAITKLQNSLLKYTDITLNRVQDNKYITDWAIDDGLNQDLLFLNIDSVSFYAGYDYSVLCTINIIGNENVTNLYNKAKESGVESIFIDGILKSMLSLNEEGSLKILLDDNKPKKKEFGFRDVRNQYEYSVQIYCRRLGINNGFDLLFDFGSILKMVNSKREEIAKK